MGKNVVNAKGQPCPKPVVMTKKALSELNIGDEMEVLVDNDTAKTNVENFLKSNNCKVATSFKNGIFQISTKKTEEISQPQQEPACSEESEVKKHVIAIKSNRMGHGSDELGEILIRAFINTIQEITPLPEYVIFYNSGIEFALKGSPVLESLQELEETGVEIIVCGTCVQHFNQRDNVATGKISNMYEIMEILSRSTHVISP